MDIDIKELINAAEGFDLSNFKGDVVAVKIVENEIGNIEAGGIGVQKVYNGVSNEQKSLSSNGKGKSMNNSELKPEKQHGVAYPVFSKGAGVTEYHIKALYMQLTARGWISTQTKEADFLRLFNGQANDCEIIWTGQDKLGNNEPTALGVSALYVLFKSMADEGLITTSSRGKSQRVGPILESHFVDIKGCFLTNVSNTSVTSQVATDYIGQMLKTMRMRPSSENIQQLLQEDMDSKYDENDRQDINYRRPH